MACPRSLELGIDAVGCIPAGIYGTLGLWARVKGNQGIDRDGSTGYNPDRSQTYRAAYEYLQGTHSSPVQDGAGKAIRAWNGALLEVHIPGRDVSKNQGYSVFTACMLQHHLRIDFSAFCEFAVFGSLVISC